MPVLCKSAVLHVYREARKGKDEGSKKVFQSLRKHRHSKKTLRKQTTSKSALYAELFFNIMTEANSLL
jgi:hypothetical protein